MSKHDEVYSVYKCDILSQYVEKYTDLVGSTEGLSPMSLQVDDRFLFFNCFSIETLMLLLSENITSSRYVFVQTMFGSEIHDFGHSGFLLFDKLKSNLHFVDPNGCTHFFDTVFNTYNDSKKLSDYDLSEFDLNINTEHLFELILKKYINDLNDAFSTSFKFVERKVWNPFSNCMNRGSFESSEIGDGHCVVTTIMLINYLATTDSDIEYIFECIGRLKDYELIELINAYSVGIYHLLEL